MNKSPLLLRVHPETLDRVRRVHQRLDQGGKNAEIAGLFQDFANAEPDDEGHD